MGGTSLLPLLLLLLPLPSCGGDGEGDGDAGTDSDSDVDSDTDSDTDTDADGPCPGLGPWDDAWIDLEDELLDLVNATRESGADCGAGPLDPAPRLDMYESLRCAARAHAKDMTDNGFVSQTGSDGSTFQERHERWGYDGDGAQAADLATDRPTAAEALERWLGTTTSCNVVMNGLFEQFGAGFQPPGTWVTAYGQP